MSRNPIDALRAAWGSGTPELYHPNLDDFAVIAFLDGSANSGAELGKFAHPALGSAADFAPIAHCDLP